LIVEGILDASGRYDERHYLRRQSQVTEAVDEWLKQSDRRGRILLDSATRKPYKPIEEEGPMNQIWIREGSKLFDLKDRSPAVAATSAYRAFRAYLDEADAEARTFILGTVTNIVRGGTL
jgi:hypothetical protein